MQKATKWNRLPPSQFARIVAESHSYREVARKVGYSDSGGSIVSIKQGIKERHLDTSHFTGRAWRQKTIDSPSLFIKRNKPNAHPETLINALIDMRGQQCELCGTSLWLEAPIDLKLLHVNGDCSDDTLENLKLVCPNCLSQQSIFKYQSTDGRTISEDELLFALENNDTINQALKSLHISTGGSAANRAKKLAQKYNLTHLL